MLGKNRWKKVRKNFFLYLHEYRDHKMGGMKRAKQFFQKLTCSAKKKCWEKNRRKKCEKRFLYSNEYGEKKCGEKHPRNNISRKTRIMRAKKVAKIIVGKVRKKTFL